jgi:hypothetical protein
MLRAMSLESTFEKIRFFEENDHSCDDDVHS